jgi:hypothetical protein
MFNLSDLLSDGHIGDNARHRLNESERRSGPCEDDATVVAPFIGMCPDESEHEDGSPLDFGEASGPHLGRSYRYVNY